MKIYTITNNYSFRGEIGSLGGDDYSKGGELGSSGGDDYSEGGETDSLGGDDYSKGGEFGCLLRVYSINFIKIVAFLYILLFFI